MSLLKLRRNTWKAQSIGREFMFVGRGAFSQFVFGERIPVGFHPESTIRIAQYKLHPCLPFHATHPRSNNHFIPKKQRLLIGILTILPRRFQRNDLRFAPFLDYWIAFASESVEESSMIVRTLEVEMQTSGKKSVPGRNKESDPIAIPTDFSESRFSPKSLWICRTEQMTKKIEHALPEDPM
jgi:hypothetical protein